ncbi:uncharacterized protein TNCV_3823551 [Trichonephila clavipes]|nr:uncharacterized protein TNCV_3823551 [Trichonephila clavipes]
MQSIQALSRSPVMMINSDEMEKTVKTEETGEGIKTLKKWLATLTAVPLGLSLNPGENMDICKCIVPSQHGCTLNSRRVTSSLVRFGEESCSRKKKNTIRSPGHTNVRNKVIGHHRWYRVNDRAVFPTRWRNSHTARATIDSLKDTFGNRLISRFGPVNWPPRSCDLTPLDYFLWGYVKPLVYADKPQTLDHLKDSIRRVIADIRPQMLEKVIENWTSRLDYIRASRGSHMPGIKFKM